MYKDFGNGVIVVSGVITDKTDTTMTVTINDKVWNKTDHKMQSVPPMVISIPVNNEYNIGNSFVGIVRADLETENQYQIVKDTNIQLGLYKIPQTNYAICIAKNKCTFEREKVTSSGKTMKTATAMCWLPYDEKSTEDNNVYLTAFLGKAMFAETETKEKNGKTFTVDSRERQVADKLEYAGLVANGDNKNTIVSIVKTVTKDLNSPKDKPYTFGGKSGLTHRDKPVEPVEKTDEQGRISYSVNFEVLDAECLVFDPDKEKPKVFDDLTKEEIKANRLTCLNYQSKSAVDYSTTEEDEEVPFG